MSKAGTRSAKPSALTRKYITRALPVGAVIHCADNSGARTLKIVQVQGWKGRWSRLPAAAIGDKITIVVEKGPPELQKQTFPLFPTKPRGTRTQTASFGRQPRGTRARTGNFGARKYHGRHDMDST